MSVTSSAVSWVGHRFSCLCLFIRPTCFFCNVPGCLAQEGSEAPPRRSELHCCDARTVTSIKVVSRSKSGRSVLFRRNYHQLCLGLSANVLRCSTCPVAIPNRVAAVNASVSREGPYINVVQRDISIHNCPFPEQDSKLDASLPTLLLVPSSNSNPSFLFILSVALLAWR
jgi:hypothetical protein